jgi:hypothetical protein
VTDEVKWLGEVAYVPERAAREISDFLRGVA